MPAVAITQLAGTFGGSGKIYEVQPDGSNREMTLPTGVNTVNQKPSFAAFNGDGFSRLYICGGHTDNIVMTEHFQVLRQGIMPPTNPIVSGSGTGNSIGVAASSGTGITANSIYYVSWYDNLHQRRSPLSGPSPTLSLANKNVVGTNLPTTCPDASATHIEVWRSDAGLTPRLVCRRSLGATGFTDATPTLSLGEAFDTDFGKFPRCRFNATWHDRQAMAGDDRYPDRLYFSVLNHPEEYSYFYLRTRRGEKIVALCVVRDNLIVFGARSSYVVSGYTEDDIKMDILEPNIGCVTHHGIGMVHGYAFVPTHLGFYCCTGSSMHWISQDFSETWMKAFKSEQAAYEAGWCVVDIDTKVYKFYCGSPAVSTIDSIMNEKNVQWVLDFSEFRAQSDGNFSQPDLMFDVKTRADSAMAQISVPGGKRAEIWAGGADGVLRVENSDSDRTDDSDTFEKLSIIRLRHEFPNGPGGDEQDGSSFPTLWSFLESEDAAHTINLYVGDERAHLAYAPDFTITFPAGQTDILIGGIGMVYARLVPRCVYEMKPHVQGRGITYEFRQSYGPGTTHWRGWGCTIGPGRNSRATHETVNLG